MIVKGLDLKKLRENYGLTQQEFADLIGKSMRTVINWEKSAELTQSQILQVKSVLSKYEITSHDENYLSEPSGVFEKNKGSYDKSELINHYNKLLKKVNKTIEDLEKDVQGLDGYKELSELIKLKAEIQNELDSIK